MGLKGLVFCCSLCGFGGFVWDSTRVLQGALKGSRCRPRLWALLQPVCIRLVGLGFARVQASGNDKQTCSVRQSLHNIRLLRIQFQAFANLDVQGLVT